MTDAVPGSRREGEVGVGMPPGGAFRQEPLRDEEVRAGEYLGVTMEEAGSHDDIGS